ncbi:PREDICTED: putative late blight resistance protein homolog R1B-17 [Ipomoea nil]|uniref:putative late blight resistance protein homolog R1B-17 n=1 Tax=Ipomoea nil TaxID=35883 RepID=UPI000901E8E5|nr:PREDICTED: putative late blight resistance protein homolog R1B-17 [Ipomoea nil]
MGSFECLSDHIDIDLERVRITSSNNNSSDEEDLALRLYQSFERQRPFNFSKLNTLDEWKNTVNVLSSSSATTLDDEEWSRILSLSYNHLPHNLKACLLYLGVFFPEDHEIYAKELARLWHAEGLVRAFKNENFDALANREAQNENLLHVVKSENNSNFPQKGFRWRSYISFLRGKSFSIFSNNNLLRVLFCYDRLVNHKIIVDLVHLRFLRVGNDIELSRAHGFLKSRCRESIELSSSWNIQTLDGYGVVSYRLDEGRKYLEFPQLHYIRCNKYFCGNPPNFVHKVDWIRIEDCSEEYVTNIPCLKKVHIIECEGKKSNASYIANLAYLEQLERLRISGMGETHIPIISDIVLLKNLRKLALDGMCFEWEEINILSTLARLEVLKLHWRSCVGKEWEIQEEVLFCRLIALVIIDCDLKHWKASSHNFPKLEHLFLWQCHRLREIPIDFAEISTLKSIKVRFCLPSVVKSAKKIQEERRDYGNYNMVVIEQDKRGSKENLSEEESSEVNE